MYNSFTEKGHGRSQSIDSSTQLWVFPEKYFLFGKKDSLWVGDIPNLFSQSSKSQTANMIYFKTVIFSGNLSYIDMKSSVRATWTMYFLAMSIIFPCHEFPMFILGRGPNTLLTFFRWRRDLETIWRCCFCCNKTEQRRLSYLSDDLCSF